MKKKVMIKRDVFVKLMIFHSLCMLDKLNKLCFFCQQELHKALENNNWQTDDALLELSNLMDNGKERQGLYYILSMFHTEVGRGTILSDIAALLVEYRNLAGGIKVRPAHF